VSELTLNDAERLVLVVTSGASVVMASLVLKGMTVVTAVAPRDSVLVLASGVPCLAVGGTHFPLAYGHLKDVAAILDMPVRGEG
jgi:hypothetical protein